MMKSIWFLLYNLLVFPIIYGGAYFLSLFHGKIQRGLAGKRHTLRLTRTVLPWKVGTGKVLLFHCASLGEYEQIKPILHTFPPGDFRNVVSFFSPSGYEQMGKNPDVDLKVYLPVDSLRAVTRFLNWLRPDAAVISKHDIWPNLVWCLHNRKIPVLLVNGTMPADSFMTRGLVRNFYRHVFSSFTFIAPASQADQVGFRKILKNQVPMAVLGDTRFDQVLIRSRETKKKKVLPENFFTNRLTIVAGSIWPSDEEHLFPALVALFSRFPNLFLILVPHEPTSQHVHQIKTYFAQSGYTSLYFSGSNLEQHLPQHRVLIVDRIGVLANVYSYGDIAYVGGSFGPGVHNVMEPAASRLPVLFGPKILNSPEARALMQRQAGFRCENQQQIMEMLIKLCSDDRYRSESGKRAFAMVQENQGATQKIHDRILKFLTP